MSAILHFYPTYSCLGGLESVLHLHVGGDHSQGFHSVMVVACEKSPPHQAPAPASPVLGLGIRGWHFVSDLRHRFAQALAEARPDTVVFHNAWACRHLVDLIGPARCVIMIHTDSDVSRRAVEKCAPFSDGILCVSRPIADFARTLISPDRVKTLNYPINPPPDLPLPASASPSPLSASSVSSSPLQAPCSTLSAPPSPLSAPPSTLSAPCFVVGYAGRLVHEQKRVERLLPLLSALKSSGLSFRFEVMGEGPCLETLKSDLTPICETRFHGRLNGEAYWHTLRSWDFIVFTSDYEGTPIALIEAMSQGIIPIYPEINSGGDDLVREVNPLLMYPSQNYDKAAAAFAHAAGMTPETKTLLRENLIAAVASYRPENYLDQFREALETLPPFKRPPKEPSELSHLPLKALPFAVIRRLSADTIY